MPPRASPRNLIACGIPPDAAIAAGSWDARAYLGLPGIAEGAPADLVAFHADPRADPRALDAPALIVLDGTLVRAPD